jgi:CheY-like chemotaxis protein
MPHLRRLTDDVCRTIPLGYNCIYHFTLPLVIHHRSVKVFIVTVTNLVGNLIANTHIAQVIHQHGLLVFANTAAARVFGFASITEFAKFAKATSLFASDAPPSTTPKTRIFPFEHADGSRQTALIIEKQIDWQGTLSSYLELKQIGSTADEIMLTDAGTTSLHSEEETYFLDTMAAAMDWTRLDGDKMEIIRKPFDYAGICFKFCEDLAGYAQERDVTLNVEVTPRAQKIFQGDALKMARAGSCMVRHAIDRVLGGRVDVTLKADERGENILFEVCDNGMPYKSVEANILFETPRRLLEPGSGKPSDIEMNLPLARCIARFLGGEVGLKVNHAAGGLIRMRLPFREFNPESNHRSLFNPRQRALDVLVVEDNPTSQHILKIILDTLGHRTTIAAHGRECLELIRQTSFDVILMDLHMPIRDGYETTISIREREALGGPVLPILAITADRRPETRAKAIAAGVSGFLSKPVHIPQIMGALAPYIEQIATPTISEPAVRLVKIA